jgi:hypothetical protein
VIQLSGIKYWCSTFSITDTTISTCCWRG